MQNLTIELKNCYGIQSLRHTFDFETSTGKAKAYAIYAPNGVMKTSFSRTFEDLSKGKSPKEERYNRPTTCTVKVDDAEIGKEVIYVLKSEIDISADTTSITNILVDPINKARYDELLIDLDKLKNKLIKNLQKLSGLKQAEVEEKILRDWQENNFVTCIKKIKNAPTEEDLSSYTYNTIFDPKALSILESKEFLSHAAKFNQRYQELFEGAGSLYKKGVFNPNKAELSFTTLAKQGFFEGGHRVHLKGEDKSVNKEELDKKLNAIHEKIDSDIELKKIQNLLAKNVQAESLTVLIEGLSPFQFEFLIEKTKVENQDKFRKDLWSFYIQSSLTEAQNYLDAFGINEAEIKSIENEAAKSAPRWNKAVELFNDRFVGMPFTLSIPNQSQVVLGKAKALLKFTFRDGDDTVERSRDEVKTTLSQGEKRALYLLNFIFDVEARKMDNLETLFILDDIADSFDYKNKHAIIQYLDDLTEVYHFHQIILTHNFDFFRAIASGFVHRERCLMTNKGNTSISLSKAEGIQNYFVKIWKPQITNNNRILCATIPFTRNLIEYTLGTSNYNYNRLTALLHWKLETDEITVGNYLAICNKIFNTEHDSSSVDKIKDLLFSEANGICNQTSYTGLNLEDKVLLSIAIRMRAEIFLLDQIRKLTKNTSYWCQEKNQFGILIKKYISLASSTPEIRTLEKVSVTVSSNIHLNSFMYEPILDLTIDHLIALYKEVSDLNV